MRYRCCKYIMAVLIYIVDLAASMPGSSVLYLCEIMSRWKVWFLSCGRLVEDNSYVETLTDFDRDSARGGKNQE